MAFTVGICPLEWGAQPMEGRNTLPRMRACVSFWANSKPLFRFLTRLLLPLCSSLGKGL